MNGLKKFFQTKMWHNAKKHYLCTQYAQTNQHLVSKNETQRIFKQTIMKKLLALLVLVFTCQMAFCQTYDELINKFKDKPEAEAVEVPKLMLNLAVAEADANTKALFKNIDCMKMLELTNCSESIKKDFMAQAGKLEAKYTTLANLSEDGETTLMFADGEEDPLKAVIVINSSKEECEMVVIEGKLQLDQLENIFDSMGSLED